MSIFRAEMVKNKMWFVFDWSWPSGSICAYHELFHRRLAVNIELGNVLPPQVSIQNTSTTHFPFIFKLWCHRDKMIKRGRDWPIIFRIVNNRFNVSQLFIAEECKFNVWAGTRWTKRGRAWPIIFRIVKNIFNVSLLFIVEECKFNFYAVGRYI